MKNNIVIGSGIVLDKDSENILILKSFNIDYKIRMTDDEYNLIRMVINCLEENNLIKLNDNRGDK